MNKWTNRIGYLFMLLMLSAVPALAQEPIAGVELSDRTLLSNVLAGLAMLGAFGVVAWLMSQLAVMLYGAVPPHMQQQNQLALNNWNTGLNDQAKAAQETPSIADDTMILLARGVTDLVVEDLRNRGFFPVVTANDTDMQLVYDEFSADATNVPMYPGTTQPGSLAEGVSFGDEFVADSVKDPDNPDS